MLKRASSLLLLLFAACDRRPQQWDAFVYPDADNLAIYERIAGFKTFELCQQAAISRLRTDGKADDGDYECGFKCERHAELSGYVCEETRK
jgi:hypothetical protein